MDVETFWNGERTWARCVYVKVGPSPRETWWCAPLEGQVRPAVEVTYGGATFFLDDEDGSGWRKVTEGHGGPAYRHRSLPDASTVVGGRMAESFKPWKSEGDEVARSEPHRIEPNNGG